MSHPEITINQGPLRGSVANNINGDPYYSFQGIPYAKPPLGDLRFKAPEAPEKWQGTLDATKEGDMCYSRLLFNPQVIKGSENCLFLNVYTKNITPSVLRPVMFWIHGGGFILGSGNSDEYGPDFLLTEDVVVVTINYRLGMLGFLSLKDPSLKIPGNAGLKDMVLALKWVQENISKFGGDPNNVTIFGESAGGASVHLLILSSLAKGLFHKAIAQSGVSLNCWASGHYCLEEIATNVGLEGASEKEVVQALLKKPVEELYELQGKIADNFYASQIRPFGYVIEESSEGAFLSEHPLKLMSTGNYNQVPFLAGFTTAEGMCFELFKNPALPKEINFETNIPWFLGYTKGTPDSELVSEQIQKFYFGDKDPNADDTYGLRLKLVTDNAFFFGIQKSIALHASTSKSPVFFYRMSVESSLNFFKAITGLKEPGVSHCDDLGYLFKNFATPEIKADSLEDISMRRFVRLWTNFAKYGNPNSKTKDPLIKVEWKPVSSKELNFLDIGKDLVPLVNPEPERAAFWRQFEKTIDEEILVTLQKQDLKKL